MDVNTCYVLGADFVGDEWVVSNIEDNHYATKLKDKWFGSTQIKLVGMNCDVKDSTQGTMILIAYTPGNNKYRFEKLLDDTWLVNFISISRTNHHENFPKEHYTARSYDLIPTTTKDLNYNLILVHSEKYPNTLAKFTSHVSAWWRPKLKLFVTQIHNGELSHKVIHPAVAECYELYLRSCDEFYS